MKQLYHVVVILSLVGLFACGESTTTSEYVDNARRYLDDGKTTAAIIELKNALKIEGDNAEARWLLGKVYFDQDDMPSADKELRHARKLGVSKDQVLPLLAQAFLRQTKLDELQALSV